MSTSILQTHHLTAGYRQNGQSLSIVSGVDETLYAGELVCLIGPNGAGKSTLLRTLAGMQPAVSGSVSLLGKDIGKLKAEERARRLSLVLTQKTDVGLFTGYGLVALGRSPYTGWMGKLSPQDHVVIREAIRLVGAQNLAERTFNTMSDGERQKILIARALAQEPDLMILDEPTAFLDLPRRVECMALLRDLAHRTGRTILLSTHDLDLALRSADRIWLLPYGGKLSVGVPEDLVLSGAFQTAFSNMGVQFDVETGTFQTTRHSQQPIALIGTGTQRVWTQRALERAGYRVVAEPGVGLSTVRIIDDEAASRWIVNDNPNLTCSSVAELLQTLSQHQTHFRQEMAAAFK